MVTDKSGYPITVSADSDPKKAVQKALVMMNTIAPWSRLKAEGMDVVKYIFVPEIDLVEKNLQKHFLVTDFDLSAYKNVGGGTE
jgi:hypothetical protein